MSTFQLVLTISETVKQQAQSAGYYVCDPRYITTYEKDGEEYQANKPLFEVFGWKSRTRNVITLRVRLNLTQTLLALGAEEPLMREGGQQAWAQAFVKFTANDPQFEDIQQWAKQVRPHLNKDHSVALTKESYDAGARLGCLIGNLAFHIEMEVSETKEGRPFNKITKLNLDPSTSFTWRGKGEGEPISPVIKDILSELEYSAPTNIEDFFEV